MKLWASEDERRREFPVCGSGIFMAHAGVTALPRAAAQAMADYAWAAASEQQEFAAALRMAAETRRLAANLIEGHPDEIALLGPTSLGLSLVALGLPWQAGDEVVCYRDDYPANVYPWRELERRGVRTRFVEPEALGVITPECVEAALTPATRLVALASCHFLTGQRLDVGAVGRLVQAHGALFCLDAIQTVGAFSTPCETVDFLIADAHKWMLGPMAIGMVMVKRERFDLLHPALVGAANVRSPNFIAQDAVQFSGTAARYEPGVLNMSGVAGMKGALELLNATGLPAVSEAILAVKTRLVRGIRERGYRILGVAEGPNVSGITSFSQPGSDMQSVWNRLQVGGVAASLRHDRSGTAYIRLSPHFYNTEEEAERVCALLGEPGA